MSIFGGMMTLVVLLIPVVIVIAVAIFQWLWNTTMPQVFSLKEITYWQALKLLLIAFFLFHGGLSFPIGG